VIRSGETGLKYGEFMGGVMKKNECPTCSHPGWWAGKKNAVLVGALVLLVTTGCSTWHRDGPSNQGQKHIQTSDFLGYQPIAPQPAKNVRYYDSSDHEVTKPWASITDIRKKKSLLPMQSSYTYIAKDDLSAGLKFLSNGIKAEKGNYVVWSDYILYRVERVPGSGVGLVGVGLRIRAKIRTFKGDLNLSGLFNIAIEAQAGNLSGELQVDVIGIHSPEIIQIFPALSTEISTTSIQNVMQALAAIKAKLSEDDVDITPHLLALQQSRAGGKDEIIRSVAFLSGLEAGKERLRKINEIAGCVAGNKTKWEDILAHSDISREIRDRLSQWNGKTEQLKGTLNVQTMGKSKTLDAIYSANQKVCR